MCERVVAASRVWLGSESVDQLAGNRWYLEGAPTAGWEAGGPRLKDCREPELT